MKIGGFVFNINFPICLYNCYVPGSIILVRFMPIESIFSNVCCNTSRYSKYIKAAGTFSRIFQIFDDLECVSFKLPTGVVKYMSYNCYILLGRNSNIFYKRQVAGKAGFFRNLGYKPKVRGVAMNPVDHPHGGRTKTNKPEVSP